MGREFQKGMTLPQDLADSDYAVTHTLISRHTFLAGSTPTSQFNITLNLDTNQVRGFLFKARARLKWPRVAPTVDRLIFPLTQVGNYSTKEFQITNPTEDIIFYHLVPMSSYPAGQSLVKSLNVHFNKGPMEPYKPSNNPEINLDYERRMNVPFSNDSHYRIVSAVEQSNKNGLPLPGFGAEELHPDTKAFILKPFSTATVKMKFRPDQVGLFKSGIFVRNNMTGIEFLEFYGEAVHGEVKFGKFKATPMTASSAFDKAIFEFDMKEKHLKGCLVSKADQSSSSSHKSSNSDQPLFTVKRTFKVKNIGQTSFYVKGFDIEGFHCEGFGFKVLNCEAFNLEPNETRDVHIAFTPDFTLSRISRRLTMKTTVRHLEALNYTLLASVPSHMLMPCSKMLPRPAWEYYLYWVLNVFMAFILVLVIFVAIFEADRILNTSIYTPFLQIDDKGQLLDLRSVAEYVHRELNGEHGNLNEPLNVGNLRFRGQQNNVANNSATVQDLRKNLIAKPPMVKRLVGIIRSFLRSFGIRILECIGSIPIPRLGIPECFKFRRNSVSEEVDVASETGEEDPAEDSRTIEIGGKTSANQKTMQQGLSQSQHLSKRQPQKSKSKVTRKKSLNSLMQNNQFNNDLDEASSTTTESSAIDDLNDQSAFGKSTLNHSESRKQLNKKKQSNQSAGSNKQPMTVADQQQNQQAQNNRKKVKKQNSVEGKKSSPERQSSEPSIAKVMPKKVAPLKSRNQQSQDEINQSLNSNTADDSMLNSNLMPTVTSQQQLTQPKKVTPVGKILPEIKRPENHGAQYGPVGAKPPMKPNWNNQHARNNEMNDAHQLNNGFSNNPNGMNNSLNNPSPDEIFGGNATAVPAGGTGSGSSNGNSPARPSLMTQLQMTRRQETVQFLQGHHQDWPGFNESTPNHTVQVRICFDLFLFPVQ